MQPSTEIMTYQNPHVPDNDVPIVTSIRPPTTAGQRLKRMIAVVAAGIMLLAGVVLMQDDGSSYNHLSRSVVTENGSIASIAEELVVATQLSTEEEDGSGYNPCLPAGGAFGGKSTTGSFFGESYPSQTCCQYNNTETYCWTKLAVSVGQKYYQCLPKGGGNAWHHIDPQYVNPVTNPVSCGSPCQAQCYVKCSFDN